MSGDRELCGDSSGRWRGYATFVVAIGAWSLAVPSNCRPPTLLLALTLETQAFAVFATGALTAAGRSMIALTFCVASLAGASSKSRLTG